jgi:hypothetical protein
MVDALDERTADQYVDAGFDPQDGHLGASPY